jgi:hypothetical protein
MLFALFQLSVYSLDHALLPRDSNRVVIRLLPRDSYRVVIFKRFPSRES